MRRILGVILLLCVVSGVHAQNISNRGKEFWVGYGHHQFMEPGQTNSQEMVIYLSAQEAATVVVSINGTPWTRTYNVPANSVVATEFMPKNGTDDCRLYSVPPSFGGTGGEGIFNRGINIKSSVPIVAYAHIFGSVSSGATMLLPIDSWGYNHYTINSEQVDAGGPGYSWVFVVAQENNTEVRITPGALTRTGRPAGVPFTATLNKGQIFQIVGDGDAGGNGVQFTGTKVESIANASGQCYPIAVFAGSSRTRGESVPCGTGSGRDNDIQQCFPTSTWGKRYLTAPFSTSNGSTANPNLNANVFMTSVYKIVVKDPATIVRRNGIQIPLASLINGRYYKFSSNTADYIEADKPIMVAQFMSGSSTCNPGSHGDPEMVYLSPIEQAIKRVGFYRNTREAIYSNYVTLIVPTAGVASLLIDGSNTFNHTYVHPNLAGYTVVVKGWKSAQAQGNIVCDSGFTAITYGLGGAESYGYNAGTFLNNLNLVGSIRNNSDTTAAIKQHDFTCKNSPLTLSAFYIYKPTSIVWQLSTLAAVLSPSTDVTDNSPTPIDSSIINGIKYYKYTLPGTYQFTDTGTFAVPMLSTHPTIENCMFTEKLTYNITVKGTPRPIFNVSHTGCTLDTVYLTAQATTLNNYNNQLYTWTLPGPTTATTQQVKPVLPPGNHLIKLTVVTQQGCIGDTTQPVNVFNKPVANFTYLPANICENSTVTFTDGSGIPGAGAGNNWYWDMGNSTIINAASNADQTTTYPTHGTYTVKHVVRTSATCFSDTVSQVITVYAKPRTSFTFPTNCLATNGEVAFTNGTTIPDGQTIPTWAWTFNDPNATAGNPNTSGVLNPTHLFAEGTYPVNLLATSQQGCQKDTTINVPVKITPALNYPALTSVCQNNAAFSIANATVTNGVTGTGVYKGAGTTTAGQFNPALAGAGTHTIWYVFTTATGCKDSVSQTILVKAKPVVSYTFPTGGCLPTDGLAQFNGSAVLSDGQTVSTWAWNFNDPNANAGNPNTSSAQNPTHNFIANGTYNISLTVTSSGNCVGDTTIVHNFNTKPALNYPALNSICVNAGGTVNVATATVTNGVTGTGAYSGPGTTAAGIFTPTVAGVGNHTIWYKFTTPNGCADSISQTILVKAKPVVSYTFPTGGCLPTNGLAQFNGSAALSDGQTVTNWAWNFNDPNATAGNPNTSAAQNPTHNFIANGTYNISLTVTSSGNCMGDTTIVHNFNTKPALNYPALNSICINAGGTVNVATATVTNGVTGTGAYSGPGTMSAGIFTPTAAGVGNHTIWYKFTTPNGCADSISQTILVKAKPVVSYTFPTGGCLPTDGLAQFNGSAALSDGQTVTSWAWNFNDPNANAGNPNTSGAQNPTHNFTANGTYNISLTVTSSGNCVGDTTIVHNFNTKPALNYPALNSICINAGGTVNVATATVTNGVSGTGAYSGPGTTSAGIFTPTAAGVGNHTIWYKFTTPNGCADSISQTILVKAKPVVSYTFPTGGCLPTNGLAQFNGSAALSDGQTVTNWAWNFNDPNATAGNPNISGAQNPTHNFTANGIYNVSLTVTSSGSCTGDTTIALNFNIKPALSYPPLATVCQSNPGVVSVATATVTNGATGTGAYSGPGTSAAGQFNPAVAGAGVHTIWYKFTTPNGCADSISQTIAVDPKPTAQFTATPAVCLGSAVTFTDGSSISSGSIGQWQWFFGNSTTATYTNGNPFNMTYTTSDTFEVKLVTVSANNCFSDTARRMVIVHPIPVANFTTSASVCMPGGAVSFTNQSTLTGNNNSMTYVWNFGDASPTSTNTNPSHVYATASNYSITLTATSVAGGCPHTISKPFNAFFEKPVAAFAANPDTLCQGKPTVFSDLSTDPAGSAITNWAWNFADGSAPATSQAPTKIYAQPGNYMVTLRVTNAAGCVSDVANGRVVVYLQPVVDAGPSFTVPQGTVVTFNPVVNDPSLNFTWSPATGLSSATVLKPSLTATVDQLYTLTASGGGGCTASDFLAVKVLKPVDIPNAFSPNGDGVNDRWEIQNLGDYADCEVQIFNRYGQRIYQSRGYSKPWDGTVNGTPMPVAVYYYVIDLKNGLPKLNGSITIVR